MTRQMSMLYLSLIAVTALAVAEGNEAKTRLRWGAREVKSIEGFKVPECVYVDRTGNRVYVSNIQTDNEGYWVDDGEGFISLLSLNGQILEKKWLKSTPEAPIHAPKGMCVLEGKLYFTDNTRLMRCDAKTAENLEEVPLPETKQLNDLATDDKVLYVSDFGLGLVYRVEADGSCQPIQAPENVNGVTPFRGKLFAVSWGLHDLYELDPSGENPPRPFGLAEHFTSLDGIEVLDDGAFLVSDFPGNTVSLVSRDGMAVKTLIEIESPADIGLDRKGMMLHIPQFKRDRVVLYRLVRE